MACRSLDIKHVDECAGINCTRDNQLRADFLSIKHIHEAMAGVILSIFNFSLND